MVNIIIFLKIAIMSLTIAPLRIICTTVCLLILWPTSMLATIFRSKEDSKKPLDGWRL